MRKHVSATKGGRLAAAAPQSMKLTFAISDVPPGEESALASGPTLPDPTTVHDAQRIAATYQLLHKFPAVLRAAFESGALLETPKAGDPAFARAHFAKILGESELLHAAHRACEAAGYVSLCDRAHRRLADRQSQRSLARHARGAEARESRKTGCHRRRRRSEQPGNGRGRRRAQFRVRGGVRAKNCGKADRRIERGHRRNRRQQFLGGRRGGRGHVCAGESNATRSGRVPAAQRRLQFLRAPGRCNHHRADRQQSSRRANFSHGLSAGNSGVFSSCGISV